MMPIPVTPLIGGLLALAVAVVAWLGDHRRARRKNPDAVGFMPWTTVFFFALFAACLLLGVAGRAWLAG
jgi:acyl-CoA synthetase (AMP-forming)/AMP-acid ligase II